MSNNDADTRIAAYLARCGLGSRRACETFVTDGRVSVNGQPIAHPSFKVAASDQIALDGEVIKAPEETRVWRYHKASGVICTRSDPQDRTTLFANVEPRLGHVVSVGRLDLNTEGLILLTNNGALARHLELPANGWVRRYRVRVYGRITQRMLDGLRGGVTVDGIEYGPVNSMLEAQQGANSWVAVGIKEGKNREIRRIFEHLGCKVSRLIRVSYGAFQLGKLPVDGLEEIPAKMLREQFGEKTAQEFGIGAKRR